MLTPKHIGLDFDGVLNDSRAIAVQRVNYTLGKMGLSRINDAKFRAASHGTWLDFFLAIGVGGRDKEYNEIFNDAPVEYEPDAVQGANDFLRQLLQREHRVTIITSEQEHYVRRAWTLHGFPTQGVEFVCGSLCKRQSLEHASLDVYVGDTVKDLWDCDVANDIRVTNRKDPIRFTGLGHYASWTLPEVLHHAVGEKSQGNKSYAFAMSLDDVEEKLRDRQSE